MLQGFYLLLQLADFGFGAAQVFLHAGFFFLELAQELFQLADILARSIQLLLGLRALVGKRRLEQACEGQGYKGAKHGAGDTWGTGRPSMPALVTYKKWMKVKL